MSTWLWSWFAAEEDPPRGPAASRQLRSHVRQALVFAGMRDGDSTPEHDNSEGGAAQDLLKGMEAPWANNASFVQDVAALMVIAAAMGSFSWAYMYCVGNITEQWLSKVGQFDYPNDPASVKLLSGPLLWVPCCWAGGTAMGLLKVLLRLDEAPSFLEELQSQRVNPVVAFKTLICCVASLLTGAAMGPEAGLASAGGMLGTIVAHNLSRCFPLPPEQMDERRRLFVLGGIVAAFGSILPAPWVALLLCAELTLRKRDEDGKEQIMLGRRTLILLGLTATVAYCVRYQVEEIPVMPLPGSVLDQTYSNTLPLWAIPLGVVAGVTVLLYFVVAAVWKALFRVLGHQMERLVGPRFRTIGLASLAGLLTGLLGVLVPLSLLDGSAAIRPTLVQTRAGQIDTLHLAAIVVAKCSAYWIASSGGLVGGIFFPLLYIGLAVGEIMGTLPGLKDVVQPWSNRGGALTIPLLMAGVPGAIVPMPLTLVALPLSLFNLGPLWCVPLFACVLTSYTLIVGSGLLRKLLERATG